MAYFWDFFFFTFWTCDVLWLLLSELCPYLDALILYNKQMNFKLKFRNNPNHHGPAFLCFVPFLQRLAVGEVSGSKPRSRDTHSIIQMFSIQAVPQLGLGVHSEDKGCVGGGEGAVFASILKGYQHVKRILKDTYQKDSQQIPSKRISKRHLAKYFKTSQKSFCLANTLHLQSIPPPA